MSQEPFDENDIDNALHEIHQMVLVALEAVAALVRLDDDPGFFQLPEASSEILSFSLYDLHRRVTELKAKL